LTGRALVGVDVGVKLTLLFGTGVTNLRSAKAILSAVEDA